LSIPTIRAWERRYAVIHPTRTAAGYRLYDELTIARLQAMRRLVEGEGWRPSQAAERVLAAGDDLSGLPSAPTEADDARPPSDQAHDAVDRFVTAARDLDGPELERVLDEAFAAGRFERAMTDVVFPALREVGAGWADGTVDVAAEHATSETVRRRLARFFDAAGRTPRTPAVLVGLPPGSHHEIGAFAFAIAGRRSGLAVLYLGADVPVESWLRTIRETGAGVVVLGVVTAADVSAATTVIDALRTLARPPRCFLGGPLADGVPASPEFDVLPSPIDAAVAMVAAAD
jgi:methanogenic corrinoid protein MtbC1